MQYDRRTLKLEAKALNREARPKAWLVTLVFVLLAVALPQVVDTIINPTQGAMAQFLHQMDQMASGITIGADGMPEISPEMWYTQAGEVAIQTGLLATFFTVLFALFSMVLSYGYYNYGLRVFRRQEAGVGTVFSAFPKAGLVIGTEILTGIFYFLWCLLIAAVSVVLIMVGVVACLLIGEAAMEDMTALLLPALLWVLIVYIVDIILFVFVAMRYCLAPYFVMDVPNMGCLQAITASRLTMKGKYGKRFVFELSFLGWDLLMGIISGLVTLVGFIVVAVLVLGNLVTAGGDYAEILHVLAVDGLYPMMGVSALASLVVLPLSLWLRAYQNTAGAGFYLAATGQVIFVNDAQGAMAVSRAPAVPVAPVVPAVPVAPVQPAQPVEPVAPPVVPVEPVVPAEPVAPAEPIQTEEPVADQPNTQEPQTPEE